MLLPGFWVSLPVVKVGGPVRVEPPGVWPEEAGVSESGYAAEYHLGILFS